MKSHVNYLMLLLAFVTGCSSEKTNVQPAASLSNDTAGFSNRRHDLLGAHFKDTISVTSYLFFSNSGSPDKFQLIVSPGPIAKTQSAVIIEGKNHRIIYADTFDTRYFAKYVWNPDTVPSVVPEEDYEKYLIDYSASITREYIERYALGRIQTFFNQISFDRAHIREIARFGDTTGQYFYKEVVSDTARRIIFLPCFGCEREGRCYITYSPKQKKVLTLLVADE